MTRSRLSWPLLLRVAAIAEAAVLFAVGLALRDREAIAFSLVVAATTVWIIVRHGSTIAMLIRLLVFLDVEFFMLTAAVTNIGDHESLLAVLAPLTLAVISGVGIIATVAVFATRSRADAGTAAATAVALVAVLGYVLSIGFAAASGVGQGDSAGPGDVSITARNVAFSTKSLQAPAGRIAVHMTNDDLFWHTFTVQKLGVSLAVPVKGHRSITFDAGPGSYEYICSVPGHAQAGMHGTLTVGP